MLKNKKIILGITASIAAYKIPYLVRLLIKKGADVQVIMTNNAKNLVSDHTLATLSKRPVLCDFFSHNNNGTRNSHVDMGNWADMMIIAPLSANTLGKMANGITDNLLLATYLAADCPVYIAPAMNKNMYNHPSTQKNIKTLQSFGNILISPQKGELANGLSGIGRMEEPENIVKFIANDLKRKTV